MERMPLIKKHPGHRIIKNTLSLLKPNTMLGTVHPVLVLIPFKAKHHLHYI
jgi:hypothetical protein